MTTVAVETSEAWQSPSAVEGVARFHFEGLYTIDEILEDRDQARRIATIMAELSPREERILRLRFGIGCPEHTLRDVAEKFDLSADRIRQIEQKALRKLRHPRRAKQLGHKPPAQLAQRSLSETDKRDKGWKKLGREPVSQNTRAVDYLDVTPPIVVVEEFQRHFFTELGDLKETIKQGKELWACVGDFSGSFISIGLTTDPAACAMFGTDAVVLFDMNGCRYGEDWRKVWQERLVEVERQEPPRFFTKTLTVH